MTRGLQRPANNRVHLTNVTWLVASPITLWLLSGAAPLPSPARPEGFYVPPAVHPSVDAARKNGIHDLAYEVEEPFPAETFISALEASLTAAGWAVPKVDPLNPHLSTVTVERNWGRWQETGRLNPVEHVYVRDWQREWVDGRGALVRYVLRYRRPSPAASWSHLKVVAVYWPPEVVAAETARMRANSRQ